MVWERVAGLCPHDVGGSPHHVRCCSGNQDKTVVAKSPGNRRNQEDPRYGLLMADTDGVAEAVHQEGDI